MRLNKRGFTLLELVTVVAIIMILVLIATPNYVKRVQRAQDLEQVDSVSLLQDSITNDLFTNKTDANIYFKGQFEDEVYANVFLNNAEIDENGYLGYKIFSSDGVVATEGVNYKGKAETPYDDVFQLNNRPFRIIDNRPCDFTNAGDTTCSNPVDSGYLGRLENRLDKNGEFIKDNVLYIADRHNKVYKIVDDRVEIEIPSLEQIRSEGVDTVGTKFALNTATNTYTYPIPLKMNTFSSSSNLILGIMPTVSSSATGRLPEYLTDGVTSDNNKRWYNSSTDLEPYVEFSFSEPKTFESFKSYSGATSLTTQAIDVIRVSVDGVDVGIFQTGGVNIFEAAFESEVRGSTVRFTFPLSSGDYSRLYELELFGY